MQNVLKNLVSLKDYLVNKMTFDISKINDEFPLIDRRKTFYDSHGREHIMYVMNEPSISIDFLADIINNDDSINEFELIQQLEMELGLEKNKYTI